MGRRAGDGAFPEVEQAHSGALSSQWIPADPALWKVDQFREFLEARKELLAVELNRRMEELLHGDSRWLAGPAAASQAPVAVGGGITSEEEEAELESQTTGSSLKGFHAATSPSTLPIPNRAHRRRSSIWCGQAASRKSSVSRWRCSSMRTQPPSRRTQPPSRSQAKPGTGASRAPQISDDMSAPKLNIWRREWDSNPR
jgi:hypothetical protein